jgi:radical SAM superfamily enzyme YgiQ (UPF0313 family)
MKILFIYKNEYVEPLGIMHLSAYMKRHGHECDFIDIRFEKDLYGEVARVAPQIIAYSVTTGTHRSYQKLNMDLRKRFRFFAVFGGPHCTFFPEFIEEEGVDAICRGEGELPLLELAEALGHGLGITGIKNLWVKTPDKIYRNDVRDLIDDLDTLPFADRELVNKYNHYRKMHRRSVMTSRGCPYQCTYCFNHSYNALYKDKGRVVRRRSIENVMLELKTIKQEHAPRRFHFWDDTFNLDHKWTAEFCRRYKDEIGLPFLVNVRMNMVNEDFVRAIKDAGCITVVTAIESGNEHIRNGVLKRGISEKQMVDSCALFNKYKLNIYIGNMTGLPDETLDMAFETLALNIACKPSYSMICIYTPYPRTELCEYSKEKGYYNGDMDSIEASYFSKSVMKIKDLDKLVRFHHLFSLGAAFPAAIPLIKLLIRLPLDRIYLSLWHLHRAWCYFFKVRYIDISEIFIRE